VETIKYVPVTRQVMAGAPVSRTATYRAKDVQVYDLEGKRLGEKELRKLILQQGTAPVLVIPGAGRLDPFYAQCFKEGTLLIVLPAHQTPQPQPGPGVEIPKK
jgi:hypothetical protein